MTRTAFLLGLVSSAAHACAVCMGDPEAPLNRAAGVGMLALLVLVLGMLALFARAFRRWVARSESAITPGP